MTRLNRDTNKDIIGHGDLVDQNTLYNITDDGDLSLPILQTLYPVGSVYITFNETCPLANLFGTWQKVGTKLLVDVNDNIPVVGNGMTVGWDDGTKQYGIRTNSGSTNYQMWTTSNYGANVGASASTDSQYPSSNIAIGITTDGTKSGMIADLSTAKTELEVRVFRRTA